MIFFINIGMQEISELKRHFMEERRGYLSTFRYKTKYILTIHFLTTKKNYQYFLHKPSGLIFEDQLKFSSSGDGKEREKDGEMSWAKTCWTKYPRTVLNYSIRKFKKIPLFGSRYDKTAEEKLLGEFPQLLKEEFCRQQFVGQWWCQIKFQFASCWDQVEVSLMLLFLRTYMGSSWSQPRQSPGQCVQVSQLFSPEDSNPLRSICPLLPLWWQCNDDFIFRCV